MNTQYVHLNIQIPQARTSTCLSLAEFERYLPEEAIGAYARDHPKAADSARESFLADLQQNFNQYAPSANGYSARISEVSQRKAPVEDITMDRLALAEYMLASCKQPQKVLENISATLYEHKYLFGGQLFYLNSKQQIDTARSKVKQFYEKVLAPSQQASQTPLNLQKGRSR